MPGGGRTTERREGGSHLSHNDLTLYSHLSHNDLTLYSHLSAGGSAGDDEPANTLHLQATTMKQLTFYCRTEYNLTPADTCRHFQKQTDTCRHLEAQADLHEFKVSSSSSPLFVCLFDHHHHHRCDTG